MVREGLSNEVLLEEINEGGTQEGVISSVLQRERKATIKLEVRAERISRQVTRSEEMWQVLRWHRALCMEGPWETIGSVGVYRVRWAAVVRTGPGGNHGG